jgi:2-isopropylmalate synthase
MACGGAPASPHESGIHQDGVLKHRETYEIMRAEEVGWGANRLVLGKLSGRNAFKTRLSELGIDLGSEEALNHAFARFKELADKKGEVFDEDLHALVSDETVTPEREFYKLLALKVVSETGEVPQAEVTMSAGEVERSVHTRGDGPIDATFRAIEQMAHSRAKMLLYSVNAITSGTDAQGEVTVRLEREGRIVNGLGSDTDILVASAKAYINALNKLHSKQQRLNPQLAA